MEAALCCCQNDYLNKASGCRAKHTIVSLMQLVSTHRDRVPRGPAIAAACMLKVLDEMTASGMPESVSVLPNADEIRRGRRELLDAGIAMHGECVARAVYHQIERALQQEAAELAGEQYDPIHYTCTVPGPAEPVTTVTIATPFLGRTFEAEPEVVGSTVQDVQAISGLVESAEAAEQSAHGEQCDEHCWHRGHEPEEPGE